MKPGEQTLEVVSRRVLTPAERAQMRVVVSPTPAPDPPPRQMVRAASRVAVSKVSKRLLVGVPCAMCNELTGARAVRVRVGPVFALVCTECAEPLVNGVGLVQWLSKKLTGR
jgi:hypothetical protein